jgi:cell division protein ZapA
MNESSKPITISIMDKEYVVACNDQERESLYASVDLLNAKMQELRDSGKVIGSERVAVMAALNIAHEFLSYKQRKDDYTVDVDAGIRRMQNKIANALLQQPELRLD